jgi:HPr kinase/phosphorylase
VAREPSIPPPRPVTARELLAWGNLCDFIGVRAGEVGLDRIVDHPRIQKSGLVLAGHTKGLVPTRVQIFGETELSYLESLDAATRRRNLAALFQLNLSCVIVTRGVEPPSDLLDEAAQTDTPLWVSDRRSSATIAAVHEALDDLLAPAETVHGVLVDIHSVGVLLLGPSGIGKSECALFLVERGHRLVADDRVELRLRPSGRVEGRPPRPLRYHLEVRGIGILNIRDLFGATAVRERKSVDLVVELCPWRDEERYERLGLDDHSYDLLGTMVPMLRIPVSPGRDMGVILEVAARNQLIKRSGEHPARRFAETLARELDIALPPSTEGEE